MAADPNMRRSDWLRASPPMFDRPWMDRFTRVHVAVVPLIFVPAILIMAYVGATNTATWRFFAYLGVGYVLWTLTEYWLHRVVFHFEPEEGVGVRLHWMIHGVHHDHPNDPMRLVMPPSASIPLAALFVIAWQLLFGFGGGWSVSAGFLSGYLAYDLIHYFVHHGKPRGAMSRKLRELHMRHHFEDDTVGYGISAPYWDRVFGTAPKRRRAR
jgi:dihydroceramide fatty acyl 2-hydroxylase